jgi:hypothetical protein
VESGRGQKAFFITLGGLRPMIPPVEMTSLLQVSPGLLLESCISSSNKFVISPAPACGGTGP